MPLQDIQLLKVGDVIVSEKDFHLHYIVIGDDDNNAGFVFALDSKNKKITHITNNVNWYLNTGRKVIR